MDRFALVACSVPVAAALSIPVVFVSAVYLSRAWLDYEFQCGLRVSTDGDVPTIPALGVTFLWIALLAVGFCVFTVTSFARERATRHDPPGLPPDRKLLP